jgi:hypothetical protein
MFRCLAGGAVWRIDIAERDALAVNNARPQVTIDGRARPPPMEITIGYKSRAPACGDFDGDDGYRALWEAGQTVGCKGGWLSLAAL